MSLLTFKTPGVWELLYCIIDYLWALPELCKYPWRSTKRKKLVLISLLFTPHSMSEIFCYASAILVSKNTFRKPKKGIPMIYLLLVLLRRCLDLSAGEGDWIFSISCIHRVSWVYYINFYRRTFCVLMTFNYYDYFDINCKNQSRKKTLISLIERSFFDDSHTVVNKLFRLEEEFVVTSTSCS